MTNLYQLDFPTPYIRALMSRSILFAFIWWLLTDEAIDSWLVGIPVILFASMVSVRLLPVSTWSASGIIRFIPFFLWRSLYGGTDVARRAFDPRLPISPGLFEYEWRLPPGLSRVIMANTVSLLPGTLSADLGEKYLIVHVLDQESAFNSELRLIEEHVAKLFGWSLVADSNGG